VFHWLYEKTCQTGHQLCDEADDEDAVYGVLRPNADGLDLHLALERMKELLDDILAAVEPEPDA